MATAESIDQPEVGSQPVPTIYEYALQTYRKMEEEASVETLGEQFDFIQALVYEGFTTHLVRDLDLPPPYFSKIRSELMRMDCIRQLRRGGNTSPSRWLLVQPPTLELFRGMVATGTAPQGSKASMQQQINDLNTRLSAMEEIVTALLLEREASNG